MAEGSGLSFRAARREGCTKSTLTSCDATQPIALCCAVLVRTVYTCVSMRLCMFVLALVFVFGLVLVLVLVSVEHF